MSMAKGLLPDTHEQCASAARSYVLAEADVVMLIGARLNWLLSHGKGKTWGGKGHKDWGWSCFPAAACWCCRPIPPVARQHQHAAAGKQLRHFLAQPLHARADRGETVLGLAFRAFGRRRQRIAAMMADQPPAVTVIHQPGGAVRALQAGARMPGTVSAAHSRAG